MFVDKRDVETEKPLILICFLPYSFWLIAFSFPSHFEA